MTGRALALATTLVVQHASRPASETRVVRAPEVLALACAASVDVAPVPCGRAEDPGQWSVQLTGDHVDDRVVAQLTVLGATPPGG